ncbi:MAG: response regulator [Verrucomicrobium sp.]|nr:response regulator [Verrucomicrobium sp.]
MKTVLAVDDAPHMLHLISYALRPVGCAVLMAGRGEEAIDMASRTHMDLLIIDVGLPGLSGIETALAIRSLPEYGLLPVIMMSARGLARTRYDAEASGANLFLTKPFSPMELRASVHALLRGVHHPVSEPY